MGKGLAHVLEHTRVGHVQGSPLRRQQIHDEAIQRHQLMLLGYREEKERGWGHLGAGPPGAGPPGGGATCPASNSTLAHLV